MMRRLIFIFILPLLLTGCNILAYPLYVFLGQTETRVKAAYTGLKDKKIAVIIVGQPGIDFEDPYARLDLALQTQRAIRENVKGVEFAEQEKIHAFQRARLDWYSLPLSEIAAQFQVRRVLYLELIQYTIREPESVNLLRGHIWAQLRVYEAEAAQPEEPAYETEVQIVYPEQAPQPYSENNKSLIRQQSMATFALEAARKFFDHKKKIK